MLRIIRNLISIFWRAVNDAKSRNYLPYLHLAIYMHITYINEYFVDQKIPEMIWPLLNQEPSISTKTALGGHPCIMLSIDDMPHLVAV